MAEENVAPSELYTISRRQIQTYDAGLGLKLQWIANAQAFAFGIYCGLTFAMPPSPDQTNKAQIFGGAIPFVGVIISVFTLIEMITGLVQMHKLKNNYRKANNGADQEGFLPMIDGTFSDRLFQRISPIANALLFIVVWTFLILYDHRML